MVVGDFAIDLDTVVIGSGPGGSATNSLLGRTFPAVRFSSLLRPSIVQTDLNSTGISTCYPSLTPFGLSLGPD